MRTILLVIKSWGGILQRDVNIGYTNDDLFGQGRNDYNANFVDLAGNKVEKNGSGIDCKNITK